MGSHRLEACWRLYRGLRVPGPLAINRIPQNPIRIGKIQTSRNVSQHPRLHQLIWPGPGQQTPPVPGCAKYSSCWHPLTPLTPHDNLKRGTAAEWQSVWGSECFSCKQASLFCNQFSHFGICHFSASRKSGSLLDQTVETAVNRSIH